MHCYTKVIGEYHWRQTSFVLFLTFPLWQCFGGCIFCALERFIHWKSSQGGRMKRLWQHPGWFHFLLLKEESEPVKFISFEFQSKQHRLFAKLTLHSWKLQPLLHNIFEMCVCRALGALFSVYKACLTSSMWFVKSNTVLQWATRLLLQTKVLFNLACLLRAHWGK